MASFRFLSCRDEKNVAVVPSATGEQISLVKTTQVSVHASPSKRKREKMLKERRVVIV